MAGLWMDEFADLYHACATVGLADPRRVDELELWEVASILGLDRGTDDQAPDSVQPVVPATGRDIIAERIFAAEHGLPPPEPDPPTAPPPGVANVLRMSGRGRDG